MKNSILFILIGIVVLAALFVGGVYNNLVSLDQKTESAWADVETQYQRRADLVPNLVETVKGAANFQQETLTAVVEARAKATAITVDPTKLNPQMIAAYQSAQGELSQALGRLLAVAESYPNLTATENFRDLQAQLEGTENRVAVARRDFSQAVLSYNTAVKQIPGSLIASIFGFSEKGYFTAEEGAENAPDVSF
ncbi:LemA family protein [Patescibacteria group bacterium]|nr:LemA family protein [Patescibacteria group bacterium]